MTKKKKNLAYSSIGGSEAITVRVEHVQESEAPTLVRVGHELACGNSVATRRVATGGREAGEDGVEAHRWPSKLERNISSLDQTGSKNPKVIRTKEKATTG
jgi:hypothetical protein